MMKVMMIALVELSDLSPAACNTAGGVGKDVKAAGTTAESAAVESKPK